jgi:hypothetical protein
MFSKQPTTNFSQSATPDGNRSDMQRGNTLHRSCAVSCCAHNPEHVVRANMGQLRPKSHVFVAEIFDGFGRQQVGPISLESGLQTASSPDRFKMWQSGADILISRLESTPNDYDVLLGVAGPRRPSGRKVTDIDDVCPAFRRHRILQNLRSQSTE